MQQNLNGNVDLKGENKQYIVKINIIVSGRSRNIVNREIFRCKL